MNKFRHVCFKDLEDYFRKDLYFSDLTSKEKELIRKNLNVASIDEINESKIISGTYKEIKKLVDTSSLILTNLYVVTDFKSIYKSNIGEVWGDSVNPSKIYSIILTPVSRNAFDTEVIVMFNGKVQNWEVYYDFTQELIGSYYTRGKILYMRDQNNNSAYYDFKNIKTRVKLNNTDISGIGENVELDLYTFNEATSNPKVFVENSDDINVVNNHFELDCSRNVFLGITNNNTFAGGFKNNIFLKGCQYNKFGYNMSNNKFTEAILYTKGSIRNCAVGYTDLEIEKEFVTVSTALGPKFVITYLDGDTLTYQTQPIE